MREYKYKGWDATGQKGWVYGDLVHNKKITVDGLIPRVMVGGYEVVPESVGIAIGMTDKEGTEVYEGDIIHIFFYDGSCDNFVVGYNSRLCCYGIMEMEMYKDAVLGVRGFDFNNHLLKSFRKEALIFKVTGNIYNPNK